MCMYVGVHVYVHVTAIYTWFYVGALTYVHEC